MEFECSLGCLDTIELDTNTVEPFLLVSVDIVLQPLIAEMKTYKFQALPKPNTYLPFGLGGHRCPGEELTKLVFCILVHHLSTTYK